MIEGLLLFIVGLLIAVVASHSTVKGRHNRDKRNGLS